MITNLSIFAAMLFISHKMHSKRFKVNARKLFRINNQLPDNWYEQTDEAITTATDVRDLEKLKTALKEQAQSFWITEREAYASWYLFSKASLRARLLKSHTQRINIKSFNQ